jgi:hypothetical protein
MKYNQLSEALLLQVKNGADTRSLEKQLALESSLEELTNSLKEDHSKKAFWINIYNAFFLILRRREQLEKPAIFRERHIQVAGHMFSLDEIEHGILRKYRAKWALGFLPDLFARRLIRKLAVSRVDYRIHFALNCGAVSCPPIAFYNKEKIDRQLELATLSFLETETRLDKAKNEIWVSRLLHWYRGDFGGVRGIRKMLKQKLNLEPRGMKIQFSEYNWKEQLDKWQ